MTKLWFELWVLDFKSSKYVYMPSVLIEMVKWSHKLTQLAISPHSMYYNMVQKSQ